MTVTLWDDQFDTIVAAMEHGAEHLRARSTSPTLGVAGPDDLEVAERYEDLVGWLEAMREHHGILIEKTPIKEDQ